MNQPRQHGALGSFRVGHATHPDWRMATELSLAQLGLHRAAEPGQPSGIAARGNFGFVYITDGLAEHVSDIVTLLKLRTGINDWVGTVGIGICAPGVGYFDEPAVALMLAQFPTESVRIFSGAARLEHVQDEADCSALIHADAALPDLAELLGDLSGKLRSAKLFGGLSSARAGEPAQIAGRCFTGGISGAVFSSAVPLLTGVTQGCHPFGPWHRVTRSDEHLVYELDGQPALDVLLTDLLGPGPHALASDALVQAVRGTLCATDDASPEIDAAPPRWSDVQVRHLIGLDPRRGLIAIGETVPSGARLRFCRRDREAAMRDLVRMCTELRAALEEESGIADGIEAEGLNDSPTSPVLANKPRGAIYISCLGRGAALFGDASRELEMIREHLGDIPLVGFSANGEFAGPRLFGYTGVLTVFL